MMIGNWKIKWDSSTRGAMIRALLFHLGVRPRRNGARGRKQELTIKSPRDDWEEKKTTREKKERKGTVQNHSHSAHPSS